MINYTFDMESAKQCFKRIKQCNKDELFSADERRFNEFIKDDICDENNYTFEELIFYLDNMSTLCENVVSKHRIERNFVGNMQRTKAVFAKKIWF